MLETPLARTVNGLRSAWALSLSRRAKLFDAARGSWRSTPALRAAVWRNNQRTEDAVSEQLVTDGCDRLEARAAVSAVLAALTSALLWWATEDRADLSTAIERALSVFDGEHADGHAA